MSKHLCTLPPGPLDVIGDIHGELGALQALLQHLGYPLQDGVPMGEHPDRRHLVFVGDLVDRGPDSPGTVLFVRQLQEQQGAICLLGNHELNLLLGKERSGNAWFYGKRQYLRNSEQEIPQVLADHATREELLLFLQTLPLAAERDDLRVVHACWHHPAIEQLRHEQRSLLDLFYESEAAITAEAQAKGWSEESLQADLARQNQNPVTVLTSGLEQEAEQPFRAGGRLRKVSRMPWWLDYHDRVPVVFGHYWRAKNEQQRPIKRGPYLFAQTHFQEALGPNKNAFCIDYSVGYRAIERARNSEAARPNALMALRWPEKTLVDDQGQCWPIAD